MSGPRLPAGHEPVPLDPAGALAYLEGLGRFGVRLGLERMAALLEGLGRPERRLRVIHVAGTNGKGSTSAMLAAILSAAGYRTGLYTSPHLESYAERIRLDGAPIPPDRLAGLVARVRAVAGAAAARGMEPPTEFEVGTAVMYQYFAEEGADLVVQETGLGGRLDATNRVERPLVTVITSIGLDHTDRLGATLADIAREKAGIIKPGAPVVTAPQAPEALAVIRTAADGAGARLVRVGEDVRAEAVAVTAAGSRFHYRGLTAEWADLCLGLPGRHQVENAACTLAAVELLCEQGLAVPEAAVRRGLAEARWPGRLEIVRQDPTVLLDGAHNPSGARALRAALGELFPGRRVILVIGMLADKDVEGTVGHLAQAAAAAVVTRPDSPRAMDPERLAAILRARGVSATVDPRPREAVRRAIDQAAPADLVVVAGSLYLVGEVRSAFRRGSPSSDGRTCS